MNKKTKKPYSLFTYFCLLLAIAVTCMGATFARYVSKPVTGDVDVGVARLACSFSLDDVSSTLFSNSDYWTNVAGVEGVEGNKTAQNHPREITFSVRNYKNNADGTKSAPSEIDLQSTFRFFAPEELLGKVAFQILKKGDGDSRSPITQQYVLPTIINKATTGKATTGTVQMSTEDFKMDKDGKNITGNYTGDAKPADYGEITGRPEETITLSNQDFNSTNGTGKIVATTKTKEGNEQVATITLTAEKHTNVKYEMAQIRGKEVEVDDGNGGKKKVNNMAAPEYYSIHETDEMVYYCLDVAVSDMILKAKENENGTFQPVDGQFIFAFTIIESDDLNATEIKDKKIAERFNVKGVSLYSDSNCTTIPKEAVIKVENTLDAGGNITSSKYTLVEDNSETELTLNGNIVTLSDGKNTTYYIDSTAQQYLNNPLWNPFAENPQTEAERYKAGYYVKKLFPTDMKVLFTQASQSGGN